jgi:hypothetical protein
MVNYDAVPDDPMAAWLLDRAALAYRTHWTLETIDALNVEDKDAVVVMFNVIDEAKAKAARGRSR